MVMHSTTKYIGGHSDVVGGALITNTITIFSSGPAARSATEGLCPRPSIAG